MTKTNTPAYARALTCSAASQAPAPPSAVTPTSAKKTGLGRTDWPCSERTFTPGKLPDRPPVDDVPVERRAAHRPRRGDPVAHHQRPGGAQLRGAALQPTPAPPAEHRGAHPGGAVQRFDAHAGHRPVEEHRVVDDGLAVRRAVGAAPAGRADQHGAGPVAGQRRRACGGREREARRGARRVAGTRGGRCRGPAGTRGTVLSRGTASSPSAWPCSGPSAPRQLAAPISPVPVSSRISGVARAGAVSARRAARRPTAWATS